MKRFEWIKTIQLVLYIILTVTALVTIFRDDELYQAIASNPHIRLLSVLLWLLMGLSFVFMFLDFGSYTDLKRENLALDQAIYSDTLTGVANRYSCDAYIAQYLHRRMPKNMGCITLESVTIDGDTSSLGNSMFEDCRVGPCRAGETYVVSFTQQTHLRGGEYLLSLGCTGFGGDELEVYHRLYDICNFLVVGSKDAVGYFDPESQVAVEKTEG